METIELDRSDMRASSAPPSTHCPENLVFPRDALDDDQLLALVIEQPRLIQRPMIVVDGILLEPIGGSDRIIEMFNSVLEIRHRAIHRLRESKIRRSEVSQRPGSENDSLRPEIVPGIRRVLLPLTVTAERINPLLHPLTLFDRSKWS